MAFELILNCGFHDCDRRLQQNFSTAVSWCKNADASLSIPDRQKTPLLATERHKEMCLYSCAHVGEIAVFLSLRITLLFCIFFFFFFLRDFIF